MKIITLLLGASTSTWCLFIPHANGFVAGRPPAQPSLFASSRISRGGATLLDVTTAAATTTPETWQDLQEQLSKGDPSIEEEEEAVLTLYRDTNGWCPFCERVWLCIRVKQLPYRERLVSLQNKPDWYKELVPTTQVPAVLLHGNSKNDDPSSSQRTKNSRQIIWESLDIMKALDEEFPNTPRLVWDTPEYLAAGEQTSQLNTAGFRYLYSSRNTSLTPLEVDGLKQDFMKELDRLDNSLETNGGPFRLGLEFSGADAELVPSLERWRYQLPLTKELDILVGRPFLQTWFDALDSFAPYAERVSGDAYSWAAAASMFTRYFGGEPDNQEVQQAIARSDAAAALLVESFTDFSSCKFTARLARPAAQKLVTNHEAVIADCINPEPKSQQHLGRSEDPSAADLVLRHVCSLLLLCEDSILEATQTGPLAEIPEAKRLDAAKAARTVATRISVPRDMGAPSAKILRAVLSITANRLEETKTLV